MKKIKEVNIYLTDEKVKEVEADPVTELATIAEMMGYGAVAEEIRNNRKGRSNFEYMVRMQSDYIRLSEQDQEILDITVNKLKNLAELIPYNNTRQLKYLDFKQEYENATFKLAEQYKVMDMIDNREDWLSEQPKIKHLQEQFDKTRDKLDRYILSIL